MLLHAPSATARLTRCSRSSRSNKAWFPQNLSNLHLLNALDKIRWHCGKPQTTDALAGQAADVKQSVQWPNLPALPSAEALTWVSPLLGCQITELMRTPLHLKSEPSGQSQTDLQERKSEVWERRGEKELLNK